jgi:hypothetical protein
MGRLRLPRRANGPPDLRRSIGAPSAPITFRLTRVINTVTHCPRPCRGLFSEQPSSGAGSTSRQQSPALCRRGGSELADNRRGKERKSLLSGHINTGADLSTNGQSLDWIYSGEPGVMICKLASYSDRAA